MDLTNENVIHVKKGEQEFLIFKRLLEYSDFVSCCYSLGIDKDYRVLGVNKEKLHLDEYNRNLDNYKTLCDANGMDYKKLVRAKQDHTDIVIDVDEIENDGTINTIDFTDGLITNKKKIVLATTNADCILLCFFDPVKKVIANVHSGWKGTLKRISVKTINKMIEEYGCNLRDIIVLISPSIRKCHFEVDRDVYEVFCNQFKDLNNMEDFIEEKNGKWYIDTVLINKIILKNAGILESNIIDSNLCSVCNKEKIHSFRVEGKAYGLGTLLISLK